MSSSVEAQGARTRGEKGTGAVTPRRKAPAANYDALVLDAALRQSLVTVRSLGSRGLHVAAWAGSSKVPAFASRWCESRVVCAEDEGTEAYLHDLERWLDGNGARVLIPSSDGTVALLRRHRQCLERRLKLALAPEPALGVAISKEQTLEVARRLGLGIPPGVVVEIVGEVDAALREVGLPAVVKPSESWVGDEQQGARYASVLVTTREEACEAVEALTGNGGKLLFQKFLSGRREAMSFLYAQGQVYARFAQWARRTDPPLGGQSVLRQSIAVPDDIGEQAERLVREISLEGYSEVEFRRDSVGRAYLMEINPRLSASVEIAVRAGVDFPYLLYQWASGEPMTPVTGYRTGQWMRFLRGDLMMTIASWQQRGRPGVAPTGRALLDFCSSFFVPMQYDYVNWRDPLPALVATTHFTSSWIGGAIKKRWQRLNKPRTA